MTCEIDIFDKNFYNKMHYVFVREWSRIYGGNDTVSKIDKDVIDGKSFVIPADIENPILNCITAMDDKRIIPGLFEDDKGNCIHDWSYTACFARFFMSLKPEDRDIVINSIEAGEDPWKNIQDGATYMKYCTNENDKCCPSDIWADSVYIALSNEEEKPFWSFWKLGLASIAIGITAAYIKKTW